MTIPRRYTAQMSPKVPNKPTSARMFSNKPDEFKKRVNSQQMINFENKLQLPPFATRNTIFSSERTSLVPKTNNEPTQKCLSPESQQLPKQTDTQINQINQQPNPQPPKTFEKKTLQASSTKKLLNVPLTKPNRSKMGCETAIDLDPKQKGELFQALRTAMQSQQDY